MIRTKDLENFMYYELLHTPFGHTQEREYIYKIVARLRAYDKLKEGVERLLARVSNGVDE